MTTSAGLSTGAVAGVAAGGALAFLTITGLTFWLWKKRRNLSPRRFTMLGDDEFAHTKSQNNDYEFEDRRYPKVEKEPRVIERELHAEKLDAIKERDRRGAEQRAVENMRKSVHPIRSSSHQFISLDVSPPLTPLSPTFPSSNSNSITFSQSPTTCSFPTPPLTPLSATFSPTTSSFPCFSDPTPSTSATTPSFLNARSNTEPIHGNSISVPEMIGEVGAPKPAYVPRRTQTTTTQCENHGPGVTGIGGVGEVGGGGNGILEGNGEGGGKRESFRGARSAWKP
ncbi:uncharacterized protein PAC_19195 [Phialocephala subalpina]|uniref:Uncharacterized protein n=1 Tax=Phialocephala subalpina TaxID=576137 RepID=A0A1L7XWF2_9HELO|nr:uncharacterized protein PAC_19195 [Phialocephala subalpina]